MGNINVDREDEPNVTIDDKESSLNSEGSRVIRSSKTEKKLYQTFKLIYAKYFDKRKWPLEAPFGVVRRLRRLNTQSNEVRKQQNNFKRDTCESIQTNQGTNLKYRILSGILLSLFFALIIYIGHFALIGMVIFLQILCLVELMKVSSISIIAMRGRLTRSNTYLNIFATGVYLYNDCFKLIVVKLKQCNVGWISTFISKSVIRTILNFFTIWTNNIGIIFCMLNVASVMIFVLSLRIRTLKIQFGHLGFSMCAILMILVQSHLYAKLILQAKLLFIVPCIQVTFNDIGGYAFGRTIGKHPLIAISPKKTIEGFVGGFLFTIGASLMIGRMFSIHQDTSVSGLYKSMVCPYGSPNCEIPSYYYLHKYNLFEVITRFFETFGFDVVPILLFLATKLKLPPLHFYCSWFIIHVMVFAFFASFIAPFGGYFFSGLKRLFRVKDFGEIVPGHGGILDRMDCQIFMAFVVYAYFSTFIDKHSSDDTLSLITDTLSLEQIMDLKHKIDNYLIERGAFVKNC